MTNEEAIEELKAIKSAYGDKHFHTARLMQSEHEALDMAIQALENIGHITDRPCDVCEYHSENGCTQWKCVFCDELFGGMRR